MKHVDQLEISEAIERIIFLTEEMKKFWVSATGWAPIKAANLFNKI